jgi:hypothetical protein
VHGLAGREELVARGDVLTAKVWRERKRGEGAKSVRFIEMENDAVRSEREGAVKAYIRSHRT